MKGQFFIIATIVIISSLSLVVRYLYDFNKVSLTKVEEAYELNYIQQINESLQKTIDSSVSTEGCDRLEADLNYTEKFLKNQLFKKLIILLLAYNIKSCSSVDFKYSLISSDFATLTGSGVELP